MVCSFPGLDQLGYAPACAIHDLDYEEARTYKHKFKRDSKLAFNMMRLGKWHSPFIGFATFAVLSTSPFSYYKYFVNKNNPVGHAFSALWLGLTIYQTWSMYA